MSREQEREAAAPARHGRRRYRDLRRQRKARQMQAGGHQKKKAAASPEGEPARESKVHTPGRNAETRSHISPKANSCGQEESKTGVAGVVDLWEYGQTQVGFVVKAPPQKPHCKLQYTGSFGVGYTCLMCGVYREYKKTTHCPGQNASGDGGAHRNIFTANDVFPYNADQMIKNQVATHAPCAQQTPLLKLATEMQQEIMQYLDFRTICDLDSLCTGWYAATHSPGFSEILLKRDAALHVRLGFDISTLSLCWDAWANANSGPCKSKRGREGNAATRLGTAR